MPGVVDERAVAMHWIDPHRLGEDWHGGHTTFARLLACGNHLHTPFGGSRNANIIVLAVQGMVNPQPASGVRNIDAPRS